MRIKMLTKIRLRKVLELTAMALKHLGFLYPTYLATQQCMDISTKYFQRKHYNNGQANAFRHALWNYLIALKCTNRSKNRVRVLSWTKSITDWHETAFVNRPLAQRMDLHNNAVGRALFIERKFATKDTAVAYLLELAACSVKINAKSTLEEYALSLVHITDDQ